MTNYEKYKALFCTLEYSFHGIKMNHVLACQIWDNANGKSVFTWKHVLKFLMAYDVKSMTLDEKNGFLATFMQAYRKDHYELFVSIIDRLSIKPSVNELFKMRMKLSLHPCVIAMVCHTVFKQLSNVRMSFWLKLNWVIEYIFLCNSILELDKLDFSSVKKYLCQCHVLGFENLLTQYFRKKGIETYSLQEGIYLVYKKNIVLGSIAYELFVTDHLLCWGQFTKDEYVDYGIESSKIDVAGYPKRQFLAPLKKDNEYKKCLAMLAGPIFGDVNSKLLLMLESMKDEFEITLKSHPANYALMESYAQEHNFSIINKKQTIGECFASGQYDFCIAVNTTAYYESWMAGVPCVRYYDERFDEFYGFDDSFSEVGQFRSLIEGYRIKPKTEDEVKLMLKYAVGFGVDNYNKLLNKHDTE